MLLVLFGALGGVLGCGDGLIIYLFGCFLGVGTGILETTPGVATYTPLELELRDLIKLGSKIAKHRNRRFHNRLSHDRQYAWGYKCVFAALSRKKSCLKTCLVL